MSGLNIQELFASLGLEVDVKAFARGKAAIESVRVALQVMKKAVVGAFNIATETAEFADQIDEASQKSGVGVEALQELAHAAKFSGLDLQGLTNSLKFLNVNMAEASVKGSTAAKEWKKIGVPLKDASGQMRTADAVMGDLADKFKGMTNVSAKAKLANDLFGKSGAQMIPLLNGGRAALTAYAVEARKNGVLTQEQVTQGAAAADATTGLGAAWLGLKRTLGVELLPVLTRAAKALTAWIQDNRKAIGSGLKKAIEGIAWAFGVVVDIIKEMMKHPTLMKVAFVAAAVAIGAAWLLALGPVGWVAAAIMGIVAVVYALRGPIGKVVGWIGDQFSKLAKEITAKFEAVLKLVERVREATGVNSLKKRIHEGLVGDVERNNAQLLAGNAVQTMRAKGFAGGFAYSPEYRALHPELGRSATIPAGSKLAPTSAPKGSVTTTTNNVAPVINVNGVTDPQANAEMVKTTLERSYREAATGLGVP